MKAILVIDFPNGYGDVDDNKAIVTLRNGKLGTSLSIYNVPLKPLPMKKPASYHDDLYGDVEKNYTNIGWNACLKEIEGD